jgi:hypothetical protein
VTLSWNATASPAAAGYNIYFGTSSGQYTDKTFTGKQTTLTLSNLTAGATYYFSATTVDANGNESPHSSEVKFVVPGILTLSPGTNPGDPPSIQFPVAPGHWYEVQATGDFQTWTSIWQTSVEASNVWVQFTDPTPATSNPRYYRLVLH